MTISHSWQIVSHARPTFCNVCREALVGVTSHGLSCGVCKLKAHKTCAADVFISCKWTTIETVDTSCLSVENESATIHHQWLEGNLPVSAKCVVCDKTCGSVLRLQDWRCLWCRATVHSTCRAQYVPHCSLGPTRHATVPPTCLSHNSETDEWKVMHPFPGSPLIIFVNSKSGNGHGDRFLIRFKQYLNPSQVYDLSSTGPKKGLQIFRHLAPLRLLVCGGDGSISWVLKEIDVLQLKAERVCVSVLPLGTGNDLARVCGWGAAIEADVNIINLLEKYDVGTPRLLDRWSIMSVETNAADCLPEDDEDEINDRKGSIFGTTGTEVIRDICDEQLISHEDLELENCLESLDRLQICKTLGDLRGQLNSLKSERLVDSNVLVEESKKGPLLVYASVLEEIAKTMSVIVRATNENSNLNQFASEIQNSVIEFIPPEEKVKTGSEEEEQIFELKRSKSKDLKEVENFSKQCLEQDIQVAKNKFDVGSLNQKLEDFELILSTAMNPFDVFDSSKHVLLQGESNELISSSAENIKNEETFEEEVFMKSITPSESSSSSSVPHSHHSQDEDEEEEEEKEEAKDEETKKMPNRGIIPVIRLEKEKNDEDDEDLLSNLSPLPSPVERSHSLTGHASSLPVPEAFSDIFNKKDEDSDVNEALNEVDRSEIGQVSLPCPEIRITSPLVSSESNVEEKKDSSKDDFEETSGTLTASPNPDAPRSRRSSRFPSNAGLLTSVPEDGQMPSFIVNESCGSPDLLPINNNDMFANQRACGSRRLSVGAMVSLSALRAGETAGNSTSGMEKSGSSNTSFNTSTLSAASSISSSLGGRTTNKTIPIINPLVKTPNWPNMDKNQNGGIVSMVVLASADALCAPVTPIMDWTPPPEKMKETSVMNNYFGIGIDAKISLDFHNKREQKPQGPRSRTKNYLWYGMLGSKELLQKTCKNLEKRVVLECDGEPIPLPSLQGIVVLNIKSFMGGTNFWGSAKDDNIFLPPNFDDGILEIVAVFGSMHMGASRIMNLQRHRIAQCRSVVIRILGKEGVPVQVDGEAWIHPPGIIRILHKNRVQLVTRDKSMEQRIRSGANSRALYREHAHPVLLPLDEEETQLLRSVITAAKQLLHYLSLLMHIFEGKDSRNLGILINNLQDSIASVSLDDFMSIQAHELRRRCAIFVNNLQQCIVTSKKSLVENLQEETKSEVAAKLSQSIYSVESLLGKCHEEGELLFFTIRGVPPGQNEHKRSWFKVPKFARSESSGRRSSLIGSSFNRAGFSSSGSSQTIKSSGHHHHHVPSSRSCSPNMSSGCLVEVVLKWTPMNVSQWLESIGLPMYCHAFLDHEISGSELLSLERRDFKDVGVTKVGHIKRLQQGIRDINQGKMPPRLLQNTTTFSPQHS